MTSSQTASVAPERRRILEALARADQTVLERAWQALAVRPAYTALRGPETGLVMIRGRMGGGGAPFNIGEATVSRATVRLETGEIGFGQTLGLSPRKAELAALFDGLAQREADGDAVGALVRSIEAGVDQEDAAHKRRTAATRVDFFTMVRGED